MLWEEDDPEDVRGWRSLGNVITTRGGTGSIRRMLKASFKSDETVRVEMQPHMIPYVKPSGVESKATMWGTLFSGSRDDVATLMRNNGSVMDNAGAVFRLFL